ncbi:MAG TPA: M81 family metallopeptidase [Terrimicrobiaceae bacterium]|nr:M81 family metallopeptidase [Terrimicrobiaceae bacterium]
MSTTVRRKRVGIIAISHESNTFIETPTTLADFERTLFLTGEEVRTQFGAAHHELSGFFQALAESEIDAVPIIFAQTAPWGVVSDEALDVIWQRTCDGLLAAGPLDGILAAPHGAAVNASRPDMDGWWLGELRRWIGPDTPLIATMDPHVNLSAAMVAACDALIAYRQNPHLDQRDRGIEAANLMIRTLRGEIRPVMAAAFPPIAINIERQLTSAEPMLSVTRELDAVRALPGILTASIALGFPYADVSDLGSAFVVVSDGNAGLARQQADRLESWLTENRERFRGEMIPPEVALDQARNAPKPVGLLDMGDNLGGGAPGDSTVLARLCRERNIRNVFLPVPDAESAAAARAAGVGARLRLKIGGKLSMSPEPPLEVDATVVSLHDGLYHETKARHGGKTRGDMGPTAIVRTEDGFTIMLTTRRGGPNNSAEPLRACGLQAADFDFLIIRGVHAPIGAYAELCPTLIRVNTPGVTSADMETLSYHHRRKPLFPFEDPFQPKTDTTG